MVRFDAQDSKRPVRVWDHIDGDLVERSARDTRLLACAALGLWWTVVRDPAVGPMLRLARDAEGTELLPTPAEEARRNAGAAETAEARAVAAEAEAAAAKARAAELEAEIAKLRGGGDP